jgi:hypothetical protein
MCSCPHFRDSYDLLSRIYEEYAKKHKYPEGLNYKQTFLKAINY